MKPWRITPRAKSDVREIYVYIDKDKSDPAVRFLQAAYDTFELISQMPGSGRKWQGDNSRLQGVRVYPMKSPFRNYLIFYREAADAVEILAVIHGARNLADALVDLA